MNLDVISRERDRERDKGREIEIEKERGAEREREREREQDFGLKRWEEQSCHECDLVGVDSKKNESWGDDQRFHSRHVKFEVPIRLNGSDINLAVRS